MKLASKTKIHKLANIKSRRLKFHQTLKFPKNFFWGTATSAHQVEGNNRTNDWWEWERQLKRRFDSGPACDHYRRFESDFNQVKRLHQNAHRFSIEWSRLEPKEGEWDIAALAHYKNVIASLHKKNITPFVTLHHFSNPAWLARQGGWTRRRAVFYYTRYVQKVIEELGDSIQYWVTFNEPLVYTTMSYGAGIWPPGKKSYLAAYRVYRNLTRAHKIAYRAIHAEYKKRRWHRPHVGIAVNSVSIYSYKKHSFRSWLFMRVADWLWNHSFFTLTGKTHDFIGVNYYFHYRLKESHFRAIRFFLEARTEHREMSSVGWEVYPQGIFDVLIDMNKYGLPIFVTENGIATDNESKRMRYLVSYLKEVYHALQAGVDVRGYFYWSLMDNFEWEKGIRPHFGMLSVNYKTFERRIRPVAALYSTICKTNSLPHAYLRYLGHSVHDHE